MEKEVKKDMKKIILVVVMVLALAIGAVSYTSAKKSGLGTQATVVEINYDGFCDGARIEVALAGPGLITGDQAPSCATCPFETSIIGSLGAPVKGQGTAAGFSYDPDPDFVPYTIVRKDGTWTHYFGDGSVLNSGTWTACPLVGEVAADAPSSLG
jgi:hypothetical protein